jgi:hypothetical protein
MKRKIYIFTLIFILSLACHAFGEEIKLQEYRGVVTLILYPAKVMKVNRIIENPEPGTSYIGEEGILVELDGNPDVMANWTVVHLKYYKYQTPKVIEYEIFSELRQITVNYHAVEVELDGDLSAYIPEK